MGARYLVQHLASLQPLITACLSGTVVMKGQQTDGKLSGGTVTVTTDKIMLGTLAYLVAGDAFRDLLGPMKEFGMKNPTFEVSAFPMLLP